MMFEYLQTVSEWLGLNPLQVIANLIPAMAFFWAVQGRLSRIEGKIEVMLTIDDRRKAKR